MNRNKPVLTLVLVGLLALAMTTLGAETKVDVDLTGPRTQQHRAATGTVFLELAPVMPGKTYKITDVADVVAADAPTGITPDASKKLCDFPEEHVWGKVKAARNEAEVAAALSVAQSTARGTTESCASDLAKLEKTLAVIEEVRTKLTASVALKGTTTPPTTVDVKRDSETWKLFLVQGPAVNPDLLNEIEKRMESDQSITVVECAYPTGKCEADPLFINADHTSAIVFRGLPTGKRMRVVADPLAEPFEGCELLRQNSVSFRSEEAPDVVVVTLHMFRKMLGIGLGSSRRALAGLRLYGWTDEKTMPRDDVWKLCATRDFTVESEPATRKGATESSLSTRERMARTAATGDIPRKTVGVQRVALRRQGYQMEELTALPIIADGHTEQVKVTFFVEGEAPKVFVIPFFYQRWWVDAGGAFLFPNLEEERLKTTVTGTNTKVNEIVSERKVKPETGIVINLHPGNYPEWALQFGLSTGGDAEISYYLGPAIRLREIGKRGLATFSFGTTLTPVQRFPDIVATETYPTGDARLTGARDYKLNWYFGISLGFNFGGVVAGADAVKELP